MNLSSGWVMLFGGGCSFGGAGGTFDSKILPLSIDLLEFDRAGRSCQYLYFPHNLRKINARVYCHAIGMQWAYDSHTMV